MNKLTVYKYESIRISDQEHNEMAQVPIPIKSFTLMKDIIKIIDDGLNFYFHFHFISFIFLFLEQLRLGVISHTVTSVTTWWYNHKTDHEI